MTPTNLQEKQFVSQNKNLHLDEPNENHRKFWTMKFVEMDQGSLAARSMLGRAERARVAASIEQE